MWSFKKAPPAPIVKEAAPIHPLAFRVAEIEKQIERGFWDCNGKVAGAFAEVARILAEQEKQIADLKESKAA